jgi:1,4-alpha-glucan branching enzyme
MATKKPASRGKTRITFELPREVEAAEAYLCGDFNEWSPQAHPLRRYRDGHFAITVPLQSGRAYRYRFLLDGHRWENDWEAEEYVPNPYGGDDSLVRA